MNDAPSRTKNAGEVTATRSWVAVGGRSLTARPRPLGIVSETLGSPPGWEKRTVAGVRGHPREATDDGPAVL